MSGQINLQSNTRKSVSQTESVDMKIGDEVAAKQGQLACGTGIYDSAVVGSLDPFALVSKSGDMVWTKTFTPDDVKVIGEVDKATMKVVNKRLKRTKEHLR